MAVDEMLLQSAAEQVRARCDSTAGRAYISLGYFQHCAGRAA